MTRSRAINGTTGRGEREKKRLSGEKVISRGRKTSRLIAADCSSSREDVAHIFPGPIPRSVEAFSSLFFFFLRKRPLNFSGVARFLSAGESSGATPSERYVRRALRFYEAIFQVCNVKLPVPRKDTKSGREERGGRERAAESAYIGYTICVRARAQSLRSVTYRIIRDCPSPRPASCPFCLLRDSAQLHNELPRSVRMSDVPGP